MTASGRLSPATEAREADTPEEVTRVGIMGCGDISGRYLQTLVEIAHTEVVACADLDPRRAAESARRFGISRACSPEELLAATDVDLIINLTPPQLHAPVGLEVLGAGHHLYNEKPFATSWEDARRLTDEAAQRGLRVGSAPDTFLGPALQRARQLVDDGVIGRPVAGRAAMLCHGYEHEHPSPDFYYRPGGGPLLDMGPYYLTALVFLLGPIKAVSGTAQISFPERTVTSVPGQERAVRVETPTHVVATLEFASGAIVSLTTSFDVWVEEDSLELYGTEGSMRLADPNHFEGDISVRRGSGAWAPVEQVADGGVQTERGMGVADMAAAIRSGRPHRASGELALHVSEGLVAILAAASDGRRRELHTSCARPEPLGEDEVNEWLHAR